MRVEIKLRPAEENTILPFNYNYQIYEQLIDKMAIASLELSKKIETSHVDYFTFSRIVVRKRELIPDKGIRILSDTVSLYVSSSVGEVIKAIVEGFNDSPVLKIDDISFIVDDFKVLKEPKIRDGSLFSTLSPIMVRTVKISGNKMKIWDLYPSEDAFFDRLRKIMLMRFSELYGEMPEDKEFTLDVIKFKPVRILVRDAYYRGSLMVFRYYGSLDIAKFAYDNGFGEKTKYGFGMIKLIEEEKQ